MRRLLSHPLTQIGCACAIPLLLIVDAVFYGVAVRLHGNDFGKFYYATANWRNGHSLYASTIATRMKIGQDWYDLLDMNPPHLHLIVWPFLRLPLEAALEMWTGVNIVAAAVAVIVVVRELQLRICRWHVLPAIVATLGCAPTGTILVTGQLTGLLLLPTVLAWRAARRGSWLSAAVWLGLLISVKPFLGLFVPYLLVERRWRAVIALILTMTAIFGFGVLVFGWSAHAEWIGALREVSWTWSRMNGSIRGLLAKVLLPSLDFEPVVVAPQYVAGLWLASAAVIIWFTFLAARRSVDHAFASIILGALLISPLGWIYYLWLALAPSLALWRAHVPWPARLALLTVAVPYVMLAIGQPSAILTVVLGGIYTWTTLLLFAGVVVSPSKTAA